jgi:tRNA G10  N-methylase Trm11
MLMSRDLLAHSGQEYYGKLVNANKYYFILSQDHPEMSYMETMYMLTKLDRNYGLLHVEPGLVVVRVDRDIEALETIEPVYIREIGVVLRMEPLRKDSNPYILIRSLENIRFCGKRVDVRIYSLGRRRPSCDYTLLKEGIREIYEKTREGLRGVGAIVNDQRCINRISIVVGNVIVVGYPIRFRMKSVRSIDSKRYMSNKDIAFMVNICRYMCGEGKKIFDPFCGYGHILEEACAKAYPKTVIGGDIDPGKAVTFKKMVGHQCQLDVVVADATRPALREGCVDIIISDLPYGRRSKVLSNETLDLPVVFLREATYLLRKGSIAILAISLDQFKRLRSFVKKAPHYRIKFLCPQYIHGGLTRVYLGLEYIG